MTCEDKVLYKHLVIQRATWIDPSKMPKPKMTKESLIAVKLKVEGGLTGNPNDSAAKKGFCPTLLSGKKYHTNKGITYVVWKSVFGTGNDQRFLKMRRNMKVVRLELRKI